MQGSGFRIQGSEFKVQGIKQTSTVRAAKSIPRKALEGRVQVECVESPSLDDVGAIGAKGGAVGPVSSSSSWFWVLGMGFQVSGL